MKRLLWRMAGPLALLALTGCSQSFGWESDLWGSPQEKEAVTGEEALMAQKAVEAESLRISWSGRDALLDLARRYEELLSYHQGLARSRLDDYFDQLSPSDQAAYGSKDRQPDESDDAYRERLNQRYSALRDNANLPFDEKLYEHFWKLSNTYYLAAEGLTSDEDSEARLELYEKGKLSGERALDCFSEFRKAMKSGEAFELAVRRIDKTGIAAIYWRAASLGKWARQKGFSYVLLHKSEGKAMIDYARELDPTWYYGAADRWLGAFYAVAPSIAGGDLELSIAHFEQSLQVAPDYFATRVLKAEYYATKMQDRELFEKELQLVINGKVDVYPEIIPIQRTEQEKAKALLSRIDEFF